VTVRSDTSATSRSLLAALPRVPAISPLVAVLTAIRLVLIVPPAIFRLA
jgi:hypothetical protein